MCFGMPEVYRVLFEAFGMDPDDESCQPKLRRQLEDVDYVSVEFEKRPLTWQDVAAYRVMALTILYHISSLLHLSYPVTSHAATTGCTFCSS